MVENPKEVEHDPNSSLLRLEFCMVNFVGPGPSFSKKDYLIDNQGLVGSLMTEIEGEQVAKNMDSTVAETKVNAMILWSKQRDEDNIAPGNIDKFETEVNAYLMSVPIVSKIVSRTIVQPLCSEVNGNVVIEEMPENASLQEPQDTGQVDQNISSTMRLEMVEESVSKLENKNGEHLTKNKRYPSDSDGQNEKYQAKENTQKFDFGF